MRFQGEANAGARPVVSNRIVSSLALFLYCLGFAAMTIHVAESFQTTTPLTRQMPIKSMANNNMLRSRQDPLYLFGRNKEKEATKMETSIKDSEGGDRERKRSRIPFFGRRSRSKQEDKTEEAENSKPKEVETPKPTETVAVSAATTTELRPPKPKKKDPANADDLKLMAERARLEAERLDAELTLAKIEKLEQQLLKSKKETGETNAEVVDDLQHQLDVLQAKLRGEPVPVKKVPVPTPTKAVTTTTTPALEKSPSSMANGNQPVIRVPVEQKEVEVLRTDTVDEIDNEKFLKICQDIAEKQPNFFNKVGENQVDLDNTPDFFLIMVAPFFGMKPERGKKIDKAEMKRRAEMIDKMDYSFMGIDTPPSFDKSDIRRKKLEILNSDTKKRQGDIGVDEAIVTVTKNMVERADGNATQLALYMLEHDYYIYNNADILAENLVENVFEEMMEGSNQTLFTSLYPKCVVNRGENKGDDYVSEEPTQAQIDVLTNTILPAVKFSTSSKAQQIPGGYVISGSHKYETGDALIEAIDNEIEKSRPNLKEQMTVLYAPNYGATNSNSMNSMEIEDIMNMEFNMEPILFVTGPDIVRDANRAGLAFTSILGLATSWYLSVYPFLLNDKIASRIDADLQLVDSGFQPDLSYLTDLSIPLFICFMGIQLVHEAAHRLTAMAKGVKLSVPVFVPSLITGITTSVTTFKTLPKNKNDMFDISASGPLAGMVVSSFLLALGAKLTLISDPATLPALPLDILRQSTLGGAIIDNVLTGSLYVPEGAPTAGITIPLHPFGVAGYVGLIVNALALLPIGSKSFGNISLWTRCRKI